MWEEVLTVVVVVQYRMISMMVDDVKKFLEWSDLIRLHLQFDEEDAVDSAEIVIPKREAYPKADIWTEAIEAASSDQVDFIRKVHAKIKYSDLSIDGKKWWESVLSIGMNAPLEELERLLKMSSTREQSNNKADYVSIAAKKLICDAVEREGGIQKM